MAITSRIDYGNGFVEIYSEDGITEWFLNGHRHRVDGPAIEWVSGDKNWYLNGKLHRVGGPAVEWSNGTKGWYLNDKRHRVDGPAIEQSDGGKHWYLNDVNISTDVEKWIIENQFPDYKEWTPVQKIMFVLRWG